MVAAIPSSGAIPKELLPILTAALKRKRSESISGIAGDTSRPYAAVYGRLLRVHGREPDGRADRVAPYQRKLLYLRGKIGYRGPLHLLHTLYRVGYKPELILTK